MSDWVEWYRVTVNGHVFFRKAAVPSGAAMGAVRIFEQGMIDAKYGTAISTEGWHDLVTGLSYDIKIEPLPVAPTMQMRKDAVAARGGYGPK